MGIKRLTHIRFLTLDTILPNTDLFDFKEIILIQARSYYIAIIGNIFESIAAYYFFKLKEMLINIYIYIFETKKVQAIHFREFYSA